MQHPQHEPARGPGGVKQEVWFAIIGGAFVVLLLAIVLGVFISNTLRNSGDEEVAEEVKIVQPAEEGLVIGESHDDVKAAVMERAKAAGWEYEWKDTRSTDIYEAVDVVFSKKQRRIGMVIYWSDNTEYLDSVETNAEAPDVAMRFKGALLVLSPLPGQEMSEKLLEAFREG